MAMRILLITQYYPPETGAPQNRLSDLAKRLTALGHEVTVLTALPSYPKGEIFPNYRGRLMVEEDDQGIQVVRTWAYATKSKGFFPRIINYLSFALLAIPFGWVATEDADIVFVESPPLFLGFSGYLLSKLKRAKFTLNISDLWPESAVVLGVLRNRALIRLATWGEEWLYRHSSLVTGQTKGIVDSIRARAPETSTHLLTNGVSPEFLENIDSSRAIRGRLRQKFDFGERFIVLYAGVHGLAQGLDTLLRSAEILQEEKEIRFCFFGDGPEKERLQDLAKSRSLHNVQFFQPLPVSEMAQLLVSVDAVIVPLKRDELFKGALPSKLFEALGSGVPVVACVAGEAMELVRKSEGGLVAEPENPTDLAEKILELHRNPTLRNKLGANGTTFVRTQYNRAQIAKKCEMLISSLQ